MKRFKPIIAAGFAIVLTLGLCATAIRQAAAECAFNYCTGTCGDEDRVWWDPASSSTTANSEREFTADLCFFWEYDQSAPTTGDMAMLIVQSTGVSNVTYNPDYLTNPGGCCQGAITVVASGDLNQDADPGTLKTLGWYWPPQKEATQTLTVNES